MMGFLVVVNVVRVWGSRLQRRLAALFERWCESFTVASFSAPDQAQPYWRRW